MFLVGEKMSVFSKIKLWMPGGGCRVHLGRKWSFEAFKDTKLLFPHSEIIKRLKVKRLVASKMKVSTQRSVKKG